MKKFILILIGMFLVANIFSNIIYVYPGDSIQDAINVASNGDTVYVHNGTYTETIQIVNITLTLEGESRDGCIIRAAASGTSSENTIYANSWSSNLINIKNLTVKRGYIGITVNNSPYCNVRMDNIRSTLNDYGIHLNSTNSDIVNCLIDDNNYTGLSIVHSDTDIIDCVISNNNFNSTYQVNPTGGGIYVGMQYNNVYLAGTVISDNYAYKDGGGIATITANNFILFDDTNLCTIENNTAYTGNGNDLYAFGYEPGSTTTVYLSNTYPSAYPSDYWVINPIMSDITEGNINTLEEMCFCFPNPAKISTKIMFNNHQNKNTKITIYNLEGQKVEAIKTENNFYNLDVSKYASGVYFYKVRNENMQPQYNKIVVVK